ncbi:MAG: hypothetical protein HPY74_16210 [Firmicutes bacterium]|nr:hypothetical protein [Elusimicrobiota bacterium]NSW92187.1 hypothetical protein [Bacillota bacterium]
MRLRTISILTLILTILLCTTIYVEASDSFTVHGTGWGNMKPYGIETACYVYYKDNITSSVYIDELAQWINNYGSGTVNAFLHEILEGDGSRAVRTGGTLEPEYEIGPGETARLESTVDEFYNPFKKKADGYYVCCNMVAGIWGFEGPLGGWTIFFFKDGSIDDILHY